MATIDPIQILINSLGNIVTIERVDWKGNLLEYITGTLMVTHKDDDEKGDYLNPWIVEGRNIYNDDLISVNPKTYGIRANF